ncbi:ubiquinone/menaquinone biosynthesis C-methylase UbiE [Pedobacter psychrotolerans]|uniref:Methyltransferase n=1 Tax=Pedobacter psychrotolerans TaxID=1843235 RepID=A0A4R2H8E3_9SPHI|nr:class I SAM-dependent methyltransferase [Pedobacter psychrotolerans]TCO20715.1 ubiquinone/menaquinone biosynthesis C-methylase UbiE [Pedobacter psychrotolerans]GGE67544.1 methyltransferase [Pedobacter psychrotolerans]
MQRKWFQYWFNSPYYHILYQQRNDAEAEFFIDQLTHFLHPKPDYKALDIACGKGRHSIYLNKKGLDVTGIDLSEQSIKYARQFENNKLHFLVHDMRKLFYINYFDIALNLFTSFGYFDTEKEHIDALKTFRKCLKADGVLVLDYFNTEKIIRNLNSCEVKSLDGIAFNISKNVIEGKIIKKINFEDKGKTYNFEERVQAFSFEDFERMILKAGMTIHQTFGSYELEAFNQNTSDRLILICKKA